MSEEVKLTGMKKMITGETYSRDSSGGVKGMTPYDVYRRDVVDASRFPIVGRVDVDSARAGARRVAWAVARGWWETCRRWSTVALGREGGFAGYRRRIAGPL